MRNYAESLVFVILEGGFGRIKSCTGIYLKGIRGDGDSGVMDEVEEDAMEGGRK